MKAKEYIAALISARNDLTNDARLSTIKETRESLIAKCDALLKPKGTYPFDMFESNRRADQFKLADEAWRAVMHGLRVKDVDPAEFDLYEGGFLVYYIRHQLTTTRNMLDERKVDNIEYAYQLMRKLDHLVGTMERHGWQDTLSKMPQMRDDLLETYMTIDAKLESNVVEMVELCEELVELRSLGSEMSGKQHDRMSGVDRYIKNNRQKVEAALSMLSSSSKLKASEDDIRALLADASLRVDIPRPVKKPFVPKPKQEHKKHKGNGKPHAKGPHKPNQHKHHDFRAAPTLSPMPELADDDVPPVGARSAVRGQLMGGHAQQVLVSDEDDTVPNVDNRSRTVSEILRPTQPA